MLTDFNPTTPTSSEDHLGSAHNAALAKPTSPFDGMFAPEPDKPAEGDALDVSPPNVTVDALHHAPWAALGLTPLNDADGHCSCLVPSGCIALHFNGELGRDTLVNALKELGAPPVMWLRIGTADAILFRYAGDERLADTLTSLDGLAIRQTGDTLPLPTGEDIGRSKIQVDNIADLPEIGVANIEALAAQLPFRTEQSTPLQKFSMRGESANFAQRVEAERPLLGSACYLGQATAWYGPPNAGKTLLALHLLTEAIDKRRIRADSVYYLAADDTSVGIATKMGLLDDYGVHMLVPGFKGFECEHLAANLSKMAEGDQARGVLVILDTLKKFVDLMKKNDSAQFANTCRKFVMAGGTILALAHTTKNPRGDGKLQYAGTSDIVDDFDAVQILQPQDSRTSAGEKVVLFETRKGRGGSDVQAAYAYDDRPGTAYMEKLGSVTEVDADKLDGIIRDAREFGDAEMIAAISRALSDQPMTKMALAKAVGNQCGVGRNAVIAAIDRYNGADPEQHHWQFKVGAHGSKTYNLLPKPELPTLD